MAKTQPAQESSTTALARGGVMRRRLLTTLILLYLFLVVLAPLSNPIASRHLTRPLADFFQPALQGLYLNHGYRFFGPEPGPAHLVEFSIEHSDGTKTVGHFPDAETMWPRLLYHRWFMLSESLFAELDMTPDPKAHQERLMELATIADDLKNDGHFSTADRVRSELREAKVRYENSTKRIEVLLHAVARHLLKTHQGRRIELTIVERALPTPLDLVREIPLGDARYWNRLRKIAIFEQGVEGELKSIDLPGPDPPSLQPPFTFPGGNLPLSGGVNE